MVSVVTSPSDALSSWRTRPVTIRSMRSGSTARLRKATSIERAILSRSKGSRRPERLTTIRSLSCTRSNVVKRPPQSEQMRRRRIAEFSSDGRLSLTWLFSLPQKGQRIEQLQTEKAPGNHPQRFYHTRHPARDAALLWCIADAGS